MGQRDHNSPPTEWCDWWTEVHQLTPDIAYGWVPPCCGTHGFVRDGQWINA